jgi:hypothetical protein
MVKVPKWFLFDLAEDYFVSAMRVWFNKAGQVPTWGVVFWTNANVKKVTQDPTVVRKISNYW